MCPYCEQLDHNCTCDPDTYEELDELEYDPEYDRDVLLAQQELEDFEQADEHFGDAACDTF